MFGPVRDQGARPTCLAFAASDAHAALRDGWTPLSCEYAYFHAQQRSGLSPAAGATLSSMLDAIRDDGQPLEGDWPYMSSLPALIAAWAPPEMVGSIYRRNGKVNSHAIDDVIAWLDNDRPVVVLSMLSESFYTPTSEGVVSPSVGELPQPSRRHAMVACGHGKINGERAILVRNSWGARWGLSGHAWLTEAFIQPRLFAAAVLTENVDVSSHSLAA